MQFLTLPSADERFCNTSDNIAFDPQIDEHQFTLHSQISFNRVEMNYLGVQRLKNYLQVLVVNKIQRYKVRHFLRGFPRTNYTSRL